MSMVVSICDGAFWYDIGLWLLDRETAQLRHQLPWSCLYFKMEVEIGKGSWHDTSQLAQNNSVVHIVLS